MEVHAFLAVTIHENRPELANAWFTGRLSIADVIELASALACNAFFTRIDLTNVKLEDFIRLEEQLATGEA